MLLFNKKDGDIFNIDNITRIFPDEKFVRYETITGLNLIMVACDDSEQAVKVVDWIFHRMTFRNGNATLDLEEFEEEAKEDVNEEK